MLGTYLRAELIWSSSPCWCLLHWFQRFSSSYFLMLSPVLFVVCFFLSALCEQFWPVHFSELILQPHCRWEGFFSVLSEVACFLLAALTFLSASSPSCLKYLEERKRFMHIFAAKLDLVEFLLSFWFKIPSWCKSVKFHQCLCMISSSEDLS